MDSTEHNIQIHKIIGFTGISHSNDKTSQLQ